MPHTTRTTFPIVASDGASVTAVALGEGSGPVFVLPPAPGIFPPQVPVLAVGVGGDQLAPRLARQALVDRLARAPSHMVEVPRPEGSTNWRAHFAWARRPSHVVEAIANWLERQPAQRASNDSRVALPSESASTSGLADAKSRP